MKTANNQICSNSRSHSCEDNSLINKSACLKIGSRDSELAMKQTHLIMDMLKSRYGEISFSVDSMKTLGDKILDISLSKIGSKALFTRELEVALDNKNVDIVVHSLKDLPTTLPEGLVIGAICERENPSDAVIMHPKHKNLKLDSLPSSSVIGTSSLRRVAQLKRRFPDLQFESIRGNLNTRLRKLEYDGKYDALVLAAAGVLRMGWEEKISQYLQEEDCMYAVGQGALAIECRETDYSTLNLLSPLNHVDTLLCVTAERSLMKALEGGCSVPLAVHCEVNEKELKLKGGVWSLDGKAQLVESISCSFDDRENKLESNEEEVTAPPTKVLRRTAETFCGIVAPKECEKKIHLAYGLGKTLAERLLEKGAKKILDAAKSANALPANVHPSKLAEHLDSNRAVAEQSS